MTFNDDGKYDNLVSDWIAALRSGAYFQGNGFLRTADDKFCCLGVLCDIVNPDAWEYWHYDGRYRHADKACLPEGDVALLFGEVANMNYYATEDLFQKLTELNDSGHSFEDIANYIEVEVGKKS